MCSPKRLKQKRLQYSCLLRSGLSTSSHTKLFVPERALFVSDIQIISITHQTREDASRNVLRTPITSHSRFEPVLWARKTLCTKLWSQNLSSQPPNIYVCCRPAVASQITKNNIFQAPNHVPQVLRATTQVVFTPRPSCRALRFMREYKHRPRPQAPDNSHPSTKNAVR